MMNYEIFKEVVKEKFMDYMPEKFKGMELVAEPVEKVNVTLDGIILREEGRNISPTIYINDMYKKYQECGDLEETLMAACDFMERAYEQTPVVDVDSIMRDANEKIVFQLINTEQNKTFLEQVPHRASFSPLMKSHVHPYSGRNPIIGFCHKKGFLNFYFQ